MSNTTEIVQLRMAEMMAWALAIGAGVMWALSILAPTDGEALAVALVALLLAFSACGQVAKMDAIKGNNSLALRSFKRVGFEFNTGD